MRVLLCLALLAGCAKKTGFILEVTSQSQVATLELVMGQRSWCERWVEDEKASHTKVDVHARDLAKKPYDFLVEPVHATDIQAEVVPIVLARDANGQLLGEAGFGALNWKVGEIRKYRQSIEVLQRGSQADGPRYVADDGCVCLPGQPWMGTGSKSGCDPSVITSFARLQDTRDCELPQGAPLPAACDGQQYPNEVTNRALPCFANANGACRVDTRNCHDDDGFAYDTECVPADDAPALPDSAVCDAYLACERNPCGDVIGCLTQAMQPELHTCTLRIKLTNDGMMHPCDGSDWTTTLAQAGCPGAILDGVQQPPFTLGFSVPDSADVQPVSPHCPLTFTVQNIDATSYDDVPYFHELYAIIKDRLVKVHIDIVIGCTDGQPSLICQ